MPDTYTLRVDFVNGPADGHSELYEQLPRIGCPREFVHRESSVSHLYVFNGVAFIYRGVVVICTGR